MPEDVTSSGWQNLDMSVWQGSPSGTSPPNSLPEESPEQRPHRRAA